MIKKYSFADLGYEVEINKFANQADGAVWIKQGGTVVLSTAVTGQTKEFPGFLPLTVDYRELFSAAGKIPGGYFKREGKFTDKEVLTARLIDRAVRPLFPAKFFDQVQILSTVYSVDKEHMPSMLAFMASSLALTISKIPFLGPVGCVQMAKVNGEWIVDPTFEQHVNAQGRVTVAGTEEGVCMLEASLDGIVESELLDVIFRAHEVVKKQVEWQRKIQQDIGVQKDEVKSLFDWGVWEERVDKILTPNALETVCKSAKIERGQAIEALKQEYFTTYKDVIESNIEYSKQIEYTFSSRFKTKITDFILARGKRTDGRSFTQVRPISCEVGLLPFTHGSALFQRGGTQALVTATLGSGQDEQRVEVLMGDQLEKNFMLHYNFPPFSVGEVRQMRGVGRREIGHGYLAASALRYELPEKESFPYTIRLVADILASDGSTSMATVCGSTLALMNAGVPIKNMVSGVAMGLLRSEDGKFQAITDITGFEDEFGWMDFKVTGTEFGVTAIQLDIKNKAGLPRQVFENAIEQAREGRLHILNEMRKVISVPNKELSPLVPKIISIKIDTDKIGAIIGPGGKIIKEIIERTKTTIDIDDDGTVNIFGTPEADIAGAINWVKTLAGQIDKGAVYKGEIRRIAEFGIFVEIIPGLDGLVHISTIPREKQRTFFEDYKVGQKVTVEVLDYDPVTNRIRLQIIPDQK